MDRLRDWALRLLIALNIVALLVSFGESFYGLFEWASHHGVTGLGAAVWPLMIDVIILVGEAPGAAKGELGGSLYLREAHGLTRSGFLARAAKREMAG